MKSFWKCYLAMFKLLMGSLFWKFIVYGVTAFIVSFLLWLLTLITTIPDLGFWRDVLFVFLFQIIVYLAYNMIFAIPWSAGFCIKVMKRFDLTTGQILKAVLVYKLAEHKDVYLGTKEKFDEWFEEQFIEEVRRRYNLKK